MAEKVIYRLVDKETGLLKKWNITNQDWEDELESNVNDACQLPVGTIVITTNPSVVVPEYLNYGTWQMILSGDLFKHKLPGNRTVYLWERIA
jgi:hypothetical protein